MYAPQLLGVLNLSADSSTKVSVAASIDQIRRRAEELVEAGAAYIDIGARSTGEFAEKLDEMQECEALLPALELLKREGRRVSVDTWGQTTAVEAARRGADMINYTGQSLGSALLKAIREGDAELVLTYMPFGDPYRMREAKIHRPSVESIREYFESALRETSAMGVHRVILDPNVGIMHHRLEGLERLIMQARIISGSDVIRQLGRPLLLHSSRQEDANARAIMASFVLSQRPQFIRTHYPALLRELTEYLHRG